MGRGSGYFLKNGVKTKRAQSALLVRIPLPSDVRRYAEPSLVDSSSAAAATSLSSSSQLAELRKAPGGAAAGAAGTSTSSSLSGVSGVGTLGSPPESARGASAVRPRASLAPSCHFWVGVRSFEEELADGVGHLERTGGAVDVIEEFDDPLAQRDGDGAGVEVLLQQQRGR